MHNSASAIAKAIEAAKKHRVKFDESERKKSREAAKIRKKQMDSARRQRKKQDAKKAFREYRLSKLRPFLTAEFDKAVKQLHASDAYMKGYVDDVRDMLEILVYHPDRKFKVEIVDRDKAKNIYAYYEGKEDLILNGIGSLSNEEFSAYLKEVKEKTGENAPLLSLCFDKSDAMKALKSILPGHEIVMRVCYDAAKLPQTFIGPPPPPNRGDQKELYIRFQGSTPTDNKRSQVVISRSSGLRSDDMHALNERSYDYVIARFAEWVVEVSPEFQDLFLERMDVKRQREEQRAKEKENCARHEHLYGHTRFLDPKANKFDTLSERIEAMRAKNEQQRKAHGLKKKM